MHQGNRDWLEKLSIDHDKEISGAAVLEIGSMNWNGSARPYFSKAARYVGVDMVAGPDVDVVSPAAKTQFKPGEFDILICLSLFEHDPEWRTSFSHNLQWIRPGGLLITCWGAEGNIHHAPEPWAIVPAADFHEAAKDWPIKIVDAFFEFDRFTQDCPGCYDVLAIKS